MTNAKSKQGMGVIFACCIGLILIILASGALSSDTSDSSSSYSSSSSSSSDSDVNNIQYDEDTGVATGEVTCPNCGSTAGVATDGQNSAFVCPNCGKTIYMSG